MPKIQVVLLNPKRTGYPGQTFNAWGHTFTIQSDGITSKADIDQGFIKDGVACGRFRVVQPEPKPEPVVVADPVPSETQKPVSELKDTHKSSGFTYKKSESSAKPDLSNRKISNTKTRKDLQAVEDMIKDKKEK